MKFNKRIIILCTCILMYLFGVAYEPFGPIDYSLPSDKTYGEMYNEDIQYVTDERGGGTVGGGHVDWCSCGMPLDPADHTELKPKDNSGNAYDDTNIKHNCRSPLNGEYVLLIFVFLLFLHRLLINKNVNVLNNLKFSQNLKL